MVCLYFHPVEVVNGHLTNYALINNNLLFISDNMIMKLKMSNSERSYKKNLFFLLLSRHFPVQSRWSSATCPQGLPQDTAWEQEESIH